MGLKESSFSRRFRAAAAREGVWLERVENACGVGFPDIVAWLPGGGVPIETKYVQAFPKRPDTPVLGWDRGLSASQIAWWGKLYRHGGAGWIVVGVAGSTYIFPGHLAPDLNGYGFPLYREEFENEKIFSWILANKT